MSIAAIKANAKQRIALMRKAERFFASLREELAEPDCSELAHAEEAIGNIIQTRAIVSREETPAT